ncbi:MAG TPA: VOC family protein [Paraburkholderia sp.]|jgi:catechol 2,3-dioxygenase-like lactoylglutathione lyase family enzyme
MQACTLRVARPTNDLETAAAFYIEGLGFEALASFKDHDGFDGVVLGRPGCQWHIELTRQQDVVVRGAPTREHLLVLYLPDQHEWDQAVARMRAIGVEAVASVNPYWDRQGLTFEDPDGYRIVLQNAAWK